MKQDFDVRAGDESSMDKYYSGNDQDYRCVGHIRGDFGKSGDEYWATFWEHEGINAAGKDCKDELTALVNTLRKNLLKSRKAMRKYIQQHLLLILEASAIMSYGYQVRRMLRIQEDAMKIDKVAIMVKKAALEFDKVSNPYFSE